MIFHGAQGISQQRCSRRQAFGQYRHSPRSISILHFSLYKLYSDPYKVKNTTIISLNASKCLIRTLFTST
uniref:Uncharacterized protein n=1 Tax=Pararge aegeria TaxID=116150 RepID=S4PLA3_9NEOP